MEDGDFRGRADSKCKELEEAAEEMFKLPEILRLLQLYQQYFLHDLYEN